MKYFFECEKGRPDELDCFISDLILSCESDENLLKTIFKSIFNYLFEENHNPTINVGYTVLT
jgi:hypothetical protein